MSLSPPWLPLWTPQPVGVVVPSFPATTFNPADKSSSITLSGGNRTATRNAVDPVARWVSVRTVVNRSVGKFYYEVFNVNASGAANVSAGFANAGFPVDDGGTNLLGFDPLGNSVGYADNGSILFAGALVVATAAWNAVGGRAGIAIDLAGQRMWGRPNGGIWNNSGTADPATGVGGIILSGFGPNIFAAASALAPTDALQANFGQSLFVDVVPVGFTGGY